MTFLDFIRRRDPASFHICVALSLASGLLNALVIAIVNTGASLPVEGSKAFAISFILAVAGAASARYYAMARSSALIESALNHVRVELVDAFFMADVLPLEKIGMSSVYSCFSRDTLMLSQASNRLAWGFESSSSAVVMLVYLMFVSKAAVFLVIAMVAAGGVIWYGLSESVKRTMEVANDKGFTLLDLIGQTLAARGGTSYFQRAAEFI